MDPFVGEIFMFGFNWPPKGFALCNGAMLGVQQNTALFSLLKTAFGGNGTSTFALPNLQGRTPIGIGRDDFSNIYSQGNFGGLETVALTAAQTPMHTHTIAASSAPATQTPPSNTSYLAKSVNWQTGGTQINLYGPASSLVAMNAGAISTVGSNQGHNNMQPSLVANFCIALQGVYPQRS